MHSTNGCIRPAVDVFAMALKYLKDHVIQTIGQQLERYALKEQVIRFQKAYTLLLGLQSWV